MHNYMIDDDKIRNKVIINITIISVILLFIFSLILNSLGVKSLPLPLNINNQTILKMTLGLLSKVGAIIAVLYFLFNKWFWKNKLMKKLHKVPDLNGVWNGNFISSKKDKLGNNYTGMCTMKIRQTWSRISIQCDFNKSTSYSRIATIVNDCDGIQLKFEYSNKPNKTADENLKEHLGYNTLTYDEEREILVGEYYTNRNRETNGIINVAKQIQSNSEYSNA